MSLGDGTPIRTGPILAVNPYGLECGELLTDSDNLFTIVLENTGDNNLEITAITSSTTEITFPGLVLPMTLLPYHTGTLTIQVTPSASILTEGIVTFVSNARNNPLLEEVVWTGIGAGKAITVDPTGWNFPNVKVGNESAEKVFTITCTGDVVTTVSAIAFPTDFVVGTTTPGLPAALNPTDTITVGVKFKPTLEGYLAEEVEITSDADATPFLIPITGIGYLIDSAYVVDGLVPGWFIAALASSTQAVAVLQSEPNANFLTIFDCEEPCTVKKLHNMGLVGEDKTLKYFWFHYEDIGVATVDISLTNQQTGAEQVFTRTVGAGALPAERVLRDVFETNIEGENLVAAFTRPANGGALSIIDYGFRFTPSMEAAGTFANPSTITPAYVATGDELLLIALFDSEGVASVTTVNSTNLECEEPAKAKNSILLPFPTEQGAVPGFTYEKQVMRIFFHYEDLGVAVVRITVSTIRGQSTTQDVTIGSVGGVGNCIQVGIADLAVTDEVVEVMFENVSGAISILDYTMKYEIKGERTKDTPVESLVGCVTADTDHVFAPTTLAFSVACPADTLYVGFPITPYTFAVEGGTPPYSWSVVAGELPAGLALDGTTGVLSGIPTTGGTYDYTIQVGDSAPSPQVVSLECQLEVIDCASLTPYTFSDGFATLAGWSEFAPLVPALGISQAVGGKLRFETNSDGNIGMQYPTGMPECGTQECQMTFSGFVDTLAADDPLFNPDTLQHPLQEGGMFVLGTVGSVLSGISFAYFQSTTSYGDPPHTYAYSLILYRPGAVAIATIGPVGVEPYAPGTVFKLRAEISAGVVTAIVTANDVEIFNEVVPGAPLCGVFGTGNIFGSGSARGYAEWDNFSGTGELCCGPAA